ncbi:N-acetylglucosamine kinase [Nonomuraea sp. NPDC004297]
MTQSLVVGVDAGATSTRVAVHTLDGTRVGYARAGAGNPSAHGLDKAVASLGEALTAALPPGGGARVAASMVGMAGDVAEMLPELRRLWTAHGIAEGPRYEGDLTIAYAAGSAEPDGTLLLSGTGAGAARIVGFELDRIADAMGWLLGDKGSGFWIGREAARATVEALDRGMPVSALLPESPESSVLEPSVLEQEVSSARESGEPAGAAGEAVAGAAGRSAGRAPVAGGLLLTLVGRHFLGAERPATPRAAAARIVRLAQADHMRLAALSALVGEAASAGDPLAVKITHEAAGHLVATLRRVHTSGPVVLAGSVLTSPGPVRETVTDLLSGETVRTARNAAGAAAWLSARTLLPDDEAKALHAAFTA